MRLFTSLTGLDLAAPSFLALALLVPLVLFLRWRGGSPAVRFGPGQFLRRRSAGPAGERGLPRTIRARLVWLPAALLVPGLLLVVVALARPVKRVAVPRVREGIDILIALDVSSSMALRDLDPARTRLDVAKEAAARFVEGRPGDRVGLLSFARFPDLRCPPTLDHGALAELLAGTGFVLSDGPEDATGIGTAAARAADVLRRGSARSKVVILLTDGEENVARADTPDEIAPIHAAQLAAELGVKIHAIAAGLGTTGPTGEFKALDTRPLQALAERTGGRFFTARDASAVEGVYREIDSLEKVEFEEPLYRQEERFRGVLVAAMLLLGFGWFMGATVLRVRP